MSIKVDKIRIFNFEGAIRGMRNPLESWDKSDSKFGITSYEICESKNNYPQSEIADLWIEKYHPDINIPKEDYTDKTCPEWFEYANWLEEQGTLFEHKNCYEFACIGPNDMKLMQNLIKTGSDESKFMRQIMVSMDIEAPLYWWKQFSTYKVGTVANSCSTMHKLASTPITRDCFSFDEDIDRLNMIDPTVLSVRLDCMLDDLEQLRQMYEMTGDKRYWRALIQLLPEAWVQKRTVTLNYQVLRNIYFARKNHKLQEWKDFCNMIEELPYAKELICFEKENK